MRNFRTRGLALAGALAVGVAGAAVAHNTTFRSTVTGDSRPADQHSVTFFGEVRSPKEKCVKRREVELYDVRTLASKIDETETDADGDWEMTVPTARLRGTQYVQIRKKTVVRRSGHRHKCRGDKTEID